ATLQQGFEQLLAEIPSIADPQELSQFVNDRLDALLCPTVVVLYARAGDVFTPLAARGRNAPPTLAARSALIAAPEEPTTRLAARRWTAWRTASLTPFERAAIETLDVAVLVPMRRGSELTALWCLGPKRSGDIYTPTDLALLGAVAGTVCDRPFAFGEPFTGQSSVAVVAEKQPPPADSATTAPALSAAMEDACVFRQEGEYWTLAYHGKMARLRDTRGLHYIARLLTQPGCDLHVRDLATMNQRSDGPDGAESIRVEGDLGAILDAHATAQYKERLAEARQELEETTTAGDLGQAARLQHEIETITEQLTAAYGL